MDSRVPVLWSMFPNENYFLRCRSPVLWESQGQNCLTCAGFAMKNCSTLVVHKVCLPLAKPLWFDFVSELNWSSVSRTNRKATGETSPTDIPFTAWSLATRSLSLYICPITASFPPSQMILSWVLIQLCQFCIYKFNRQFLSTISLPRPWQRCQRCQRCQKPGCWCGNRTGNESCYTDVSARSKRTWGERWKRYIWYRFKMIYINDLKSKHIVKHYEIHIKRI